jgi:hypothetical protein
MEVDKPTMKMVQSAWPGPIRFQNIPARSWLLNVAYHKIATLRLMPFVNGDEIILTDVDTFYCGNPFDAFDQEFDIGYTSRPRNEPTVNLGFVAFRWSARVRQFVDTWIQQIDSPSYPPYVEWLVCLGRLGRRDMFPDQDFMSVAVHRNPHQKVKLYDLGPDYNWYPSIDTADKLEIAWQEVRKAAKRPETRMIHLKGHLKPLGKRLLELL